MIEWDFNSAVPIDCPNCGERFEVPTRLLAEGGKMRCPHCDADVEVVGVEENG